MSSSIVEKFESMEYGPALEDASEVTRWLEAHGRRFGSYIDGAWTAAGAGETFAVKNPATGELLANVESAGAAEVDRAVAAARAALPEWQALPGHWRARYLYALARQVQKHARRLAVLETLDNGKSIRESRDIDIPLVARHFYHHAGWAQLLGNLGAKGFDGRVCRVCAGGRGGADYSVEFSAADVCVEGGAGAGCGMHGRDKARRVHAADGHHVRRDRRRDWSAEGCAECGERRWADGCGDRRASGHRQDCVHRLDRSWPNYSQGYGGDFEEAFTRAWWEVTVRRLR